ncbi:MAG: ribosomal protein S18-alanine N-acetyltransferase [Clostridia bacterium]|nr:ribosomal protein S18-alanine N-acetyltransferase [Clostridia bacterium]
MEIVIEKMSTYDLENIKDILNLEFDDFWNYNILKQELLNENSIYLVAKNSEGLILGFSGVQFILDEADITNIVTRKSFRNKGIGSKLLENLIIASKEKNMSSITLEVNENNIYAISLYKKFNFETTGLRKKYYNGTDNAIIMTLKI